jgi:hypothetical protein
MHAREWWKRSGQGTGVKGQCNEIFDPLISPINLPYTIKRIRGTGRVRSRKLYSITYRQMFRNQNLKGIVSRGFVVCICRSDRNSVTRFAHMLLVSINTDLTLLPLTERVQLLEKYRFRVEFLGFRVSA